MTENKTSFSTQILDIQKQYDMLIGMPKNFISICIKLREDFELLRIKENKVLFFNKDTNLYQNLLHISILNPSKLKYYFVSIKNFNNYFPLSQINKILYLFLLFIIFYLIKYIGLLKLFCIAILIKNKQEKLYSV